MIQGLAGGGAERIVVDLARTYKSLGHNVVVVSLYNGGPREEELKRYGIRYKIFKRSGYFGFTMMNQIEDYLKEFKPDILHTQLFAAFARGAILGKRLGVPVVHTLQNTRLEDSFLKKITRKFFHNRVNLVAITRAVRDDYVARFGYDSSKVSIIPNAIDIADYPFELSKMTHGTIGFAGRLEEQKGCDVLLNALSRVSNVNLRIVGDGSLMSNLKKQASTLGIRNRVSFLGWVSDMSRFYKGIDMLVVPSRWEGQGIVVLEAMSSGVPVIASDVDGPAEIIEDYRTGRLVASESPADLAATIQWAYAYPDKMQAYANAAHENVSRNYTLQKMAEQYLSIYEKLAAKTSKL